jgi:Acyl-CoA thioester hydrolase/BAAT N-terminal region
MPVTTATPARMAPHIVITPTPALVDASVRIQLLDFTPHTHVTLRAQSGDGYGSHYHAHATFQTNHRGAVNVSVQKPLSGSYDDVDAMGLVWSGVRSPADAGGADVTWMHVSSPSLYFTAEVAGRVVASTMLERRFAAPGVTKRDVRDGEVTGVFFTPASPGHHPGCYVSMAPPAGRQAEQLHVGAVYPRPRPRPESASSSRGGSTSERICLKAWLCTAEASTTEEPDAGKLHVRVCTGGAG